MISKKVAFSWQKDIHRQFQPSSQPGNLTLNRKSTNSRPIAEHLRFGHIDKDETLPLTILNLRIVSGYPECQQGRNLRLCPVVP